MSSTETPLAYFITWTVYGTFLHGDARWWRKKGQGEQRPQPLLEQWHRDRRKHDIVLLNDHQREIVNAEIVRHCLHRHWQLWTANPRTNHVHVVITAKDVTGKMVRDQLKANCTRGIREQYKLFVDRPVWTVGGDWQCINSDDDLEQAVLYASEAQERKGALESLFNSAVDRQ